MKEQQTLRFQAGRAHPGRRGVRLIEEGTAGLITRLKKCENRKRTQVFLANKGRMELTPLRKT